ncbi:Inositol 2-dehydrogenase [Nymphon striatum]|nr:Inositol 2-dehydrogenase [Nymphon striatum]
MYTSDNNNCTVKIRDKSIDLKETKDLYGRLMVLARSSRDVDQKEAIGNFRWLSTKFDEMKKCRTYDSVGIALFGMGRAARIHLTNILNSRNCKLIYVVDRYDLDHANTLKEAWNLTGTTMVTFSESGCVFQDERVHAVVIASPTDTHIEIIKKALESGKKVFCEKPISLDEESVTECYKLAHSKGLPLMAAMQRRFDPGFASVRKAVQCGEIGKVYTIKSCSRDSPLPTIDYIKSSGGFIHDCLIHDIDIICNIINEFPITVSVIGNANDLKIKEVGDIDTVAITMKFPSGAIALIDASRHSVYGYDQRLEVHGSNGMLTINNERPSGVIKSGSTGCEAVPMYFSFPSRYLEAYSNELEHFIDVCQGRSSLSVTQQQVMNVGKVLAACEKSLESKSVVEIKWTNHVSDCVK